MFFLDRAIRLFCCRIAMSLVILRKGISIDTRCGGTQMHTYQRHRAKFSHWAAAIAVGWVIAPVVEAQQSTAATSDTSTQLEQVVVTASRQGAENIQNVPMAISAISPDSLERFGLGGLEDYAKLVPSLSLQQFGPGINKIDIRGITTSGIDYTDVQDRRWSPFIWTIRRSPCRPRTRTSRYSTWNAPKSCGDRKARCTAPEQWPAPSG